MRTDTVSREITFNDLDGHKEAPQDIDFKKDFVSRFIKYLYSSGNKTDGYN